MSLQFSARRAFGAASILALGLSPLALSGTAHADEISASAAVADSQRLEYTARPGRQQRGRSVAGARTRPS